jgi:hypothetical protein
LIGVAVPVNVGSGSKVTTPVVGSTLHVPSLATTMFEVAVHDASAVPAVQIFTLVAENGYDVPPTDPGVSSANGVNV